MANKLYFGDCLDVMREDIETESVDLIYLDPPFNSKRIYNASMGGAQWVAFKDTWRWHEAIDDFHSVAGDVQLSGTMEGLRLMLGEGCDLAYLSYMANRLRECRRVLKNTGSIYLHCDPTMNYLLRAVMDAIFERQNFRNEIVWCYKSGGASKKHFARKHDTILLYGHPERTFNSLKVKSYGQTGGGQGGKVKYFADTKGTYSIVNARDWWEISMLATTHSERLGYPTQKPLKLMHRIIRASSNEGDVVFDPFCGCGTTVHAAQALDRQWVGIDICVTACQVIEKRLRRTLTRYGPTWNSSACQRPPTTLRRSPASTSLSSRNGQRHWFPWMEANKRQRGDAGIDGHGRLPLRKGQFIDIVSQVKGGGTGPGDVQAFNGARQQAGADMGIFTCFEDRVTNGMRDAAASTGHFMEAPVVQIYTVEDFFERRSPKLPKVA